MNEPSHVTPVATYSCGPFLVSELAYPPGFRQARHAHDIAGVSMVLAGTIRETSGRTTACATALSVVVKPADIEHADEVGPNGLRTLQTLFDDSYARTLDNAGGGLGCWRWLHAPPAVRDMLALLRLLRMDGANASMEDAVVAVLSGVQGDSLPRQNIPDWIRQIREELDDRPADNIRVSDLAAAAGVHPVSLARVFRRHYGVSVTVYRKRVRLQRAAQGATHGAAPLGRIAHDSGYADQAHFCRDFRKATGVTPSTFRGLIRSDRVPPLAEV